MSLSKIWFTSDTHFDHVNIVRYCNRPFDSCSHMNEELIRRWNEVVGINDEVYHLGDFCMSRDPKRWLAYLSRLNGNIYLIKGNHDKQKTIDKVQEAESKKFVWIKDYFYLKSQYYNKKVDITMMHYSMRVWDRSHHGSYNIFGHSHGGLKDLGESLSMDVGVDTNNYYPYNLNKVVEILQKKEKEKSENT